MKILVDTNVILDVLLARKNFFEPAAQIIGMAERSEIEAYVCATTITTIDYLLNRSLTKSKSYKALHHLIEIFEIAPVTRSVIEEALLSKMDDFEDAVLSQSGLLVGAELIVTRNPKDFKNSKLKVANPIEFLTLHNQRISD